jgi:glycosyltransferase involved in cell wall biosynthesis
MKKRVFMLTTESPERLGGANRLASQMTRLLEERGYGIQTFHKENSLPAWLQSPSSWLGRHFAGAMLGFFVGREAKKHLTPEVVAVISQGPIGWYPFRWPGSALKKIHFYHGTYWGVAESIRPFISYRGYLKMKWWDAKVLERLSGRGKLCVSNSDQTREEVQRLFGYTCETVWLPMDTSFFRPLDRAHCRSALGLPADTCIGLFAGNAQPNKGFPIVLALMQLFPQLHWALLFRGAPPDGLKPCAQITIFEDVPDVQVPLLYNAADFSVCPSRYDGFAYVVAEALACGTPVVAGPTGASPLFLCEPPLDRLFIADPENVEGFRAAISGVLADPGRYRRIILEKVRPAIEARMSPPSWWKRFAEVTEL